MKKELNSIIDLNMQIIKIRLWHQLRNNGIGTIIVEGPKYKNNHLGLKDSSKDESMVANFQ